MNRKLKALGLALFAVLGMGALSATAASAGDFHSQVAHTTISGSQVGEDKLTVNAGTVTCQEATYAGTQSASTATTVTVTPTYTNCKAFGFINATIDVNGCRYVLSADSSFIGIDCTETTWEGGSVKLYHERFLTVTAFNCWVTVGSQTALGASYFNTGSGWSGDVDVTFNITGLKYTQHSKSFPGCSGGARTDGSYTGAATVRGFNTEGVQIGIWRE